MRKFLVTGVGAIIGYGIVRSLKLHDPSCHVLGIDINDDAVGRHWCDEFVLAPKTDSAGYLHWILGLLADQSISLVFPGIEPDVNFFSEHRQSFVGLTNLAINEPNLIRITQDKWLMHEKLMSFGEDVVIPSILSASYAELSSTLGATFLLKPRRGSASKGIVKIATEHEFFEYKHLLGNSLFAQEIVGTDDEEYTAAAFCDGLGGASAVITLQRRLASTGSTEKARVVQLPDLDVVINRLCDEFKPIGPTNLQFRKVQGSWKLLEINPRISSSTSIRTAFGFNESAMCVDFYLEGKTPAAPSVKRGSAIRYIEDLVTLDSANI